MENDGGAAETEAAIVQRLRARAPADDEDETAHWGEDVAVVATGSFRGDKHASEETPLLHRPTDPTDPHAHGNEWPGQADFDGLPWWKKPSVSS